MTVTAERPLRILIVEDSNEDAELILAELRRAGLGVELQRVDTEADYLRALDEQPDLILAAHTLPQFDARQALCLIRERDLNIPLVVVTQSVGEERAVECMREGANDYLLKDRLSRLGPAVERALEQRRLRAEAEQTQAALRDREHHFRDLVNHAQDLILIVDEDNTVRYQSPSVERVLGYSPSERLGRGVFELVHPDDQLVLRGRLAEGFRNPGAPQLFVARFRHRDGSYRVLESIGSVLPRADGALEAIVNVRDITDRLELEDQLRRAQKLEAIGRLAGGVAHDFNNLLTVIGGYAELLEDQLRQGVTDATFVEEIVRAKERGATLARQLLTFARQDVVSPRQLDLNGVVEELHGLLVRLIGADIEVVLRMGKTAGTVRIDSGQLEQVVVNLVVNARDALMEGGRITIVTHEEHIDATPGVSFRHVPAGRWICLSVSDNGMGMSEDTAMQIFEPFFTTKPPGKGTGLGLSTVYGIVKQAGGHVTVESQPDVGSTLCVYLPHYESATDQGPGEQCAGTVTTGAETILVAEDDDAIRNLLVKILQRSGYTILEAQNGAAALEIAERSTERIDLVITDLIMPEMNGTEFATRLLAQREDVQVLLISGYSDVIISPELLRRSQLLPKPFTPAALTRKVRELLDD